MGGANNKSTATSLNEALQHVPGVSVTDIFLGGGAQLTVRGVTAGLALFGSVPSPITWTQCRSDS